MVESFPSLQEVLGSIPSTSQSHKLGVDVHARDLEIRETEAKGSKVQCHPQIYSKFKARLHYMRQSQGEKKSFTGKPYILRLS